MIKNNPISLLGRNNIDAMEAWNTWNMDFGILTKWYTYFHVVSSQIYEKVLPYLQVYMIVLRYQNLCVEHVFWSIFKTPLWILNNKFCQTISTWTLLFKNHLFQLDFFAEFCTYLGWKLQLSICSSCRGTLLFTLLLDIPI